MSFKIFTLQLFGKIKPVEKIELKRKLQLEDYNNFLQVERSEELKLYYALEQKVNSIEFKQKKAEIDALQFKGSKEYNVLQEYSVLEKNKSIRKYFKTHNSPELKRYEEIKDSEKLKEFDRFSEYVLEGEFEKKKNELLSRSYKGSVEEKHHLDLKKLESTPEMKAYLKLHNSEKIRNHELTGKSDKIKRYLDLKASPEKEGPKKKEYKALAKDPDIRNYFKFEHSNLLKLYREAAGSHNLKKYGELKLYVDNEQYRSRVDFLKDKKKFEKSEAYKKWKKYKELKNDADIRFFMKYEKSDVFKNYLNVKDSFELKRYLELLEVVSSQEFLERKAYLEDNKKWEKTREFEDEMKFRELKNNPQLKKYLEDKERDSFRFFREWEVSFEENFVSSGLDKEKWSLMPLWAEKLLGRNYSMPGDLHAFTVGKNIKTGGKLIIETRHENIESLVWEMPAGFVSRKFEYTSGMISSAKSFWQSDGIFEAKIKFNPVKEVVSGCVLQGENKSQRVFLLEMGAKNRLGIAQTGNNGKQELEGIDISNLNKNKWYIFTVEKTSHTFTWKINDTEVLKLERNGIDSPLHIDLMTLVLDPISGSKLPVQFQTKWVRCYKRKN